MFFSHPELDQIIKKHRMEAERIISTSGSKKLAKTFQAVWESIDRNLIDADTSSDLLTITPDLICQYISRWITEVDLFKQQKVAEFNRIEKPTPAEKIAFQKLCIHIDGRVLPTYETLRKRIYPVYEEFANAALAYLSPLHQSVNDMHQLYNEMNGIKGDFTGFENVSVYIHGIEDTGKDFLESAIKAAEDGDIIVYEDRHGVEQYYVVSLVKGVKEVNDEPLTFEELLLTNQYNEKNGRLHVVYETEFKNEHRQSTSDDLAEKLIEMGLLNDETKIDMFAHSYGGRRSMQFAMDYPSHVRSITTIGTPYDKNLLAKGANTFTKFAEKQGQDPTEFSYYLDFNQKNQRTDNGLTHSNVYTDMSSEKMIEDIEQLKVANPEAYKELEKIMITAVAGRDTETRTYYNEFYGREMEYVVADTHDGLVSVKSQHGISLGSLINERLEYDVEGYGLTDSAHLYQIKNEDFIELIRKVNQEHKE